LLKHCLNEALLGKKLPAFSAEQDTVLMLLQRVQEAQRIAIRELKDQDFDGKAVDSAAALEAEVRFLLFECHLSVLCSTLLTLHAGFYGRQYKAKEQTARSQERGREEEATGRRWGWRQKVQEALGI
jgi:hypothetical protein